MNNTPKCPYCGDEMKIRVSLITPDWGLLSAQYKCMTCESTSPRIEFSGGTPNEKIIERLLAVSSRRAEPKNRVLMLEEARNAEVDTFGTAMHWLELKIHPCKVQCEEIRCAVLAVSIFFEDQSEDGEPDAVYSYADRHDEWLIQQEYGKRWRCWLRKPTAEEMEETPWNGGAEE